jgi:hypothetical protein
MSMAGVLILEWKNARADKRLRRQKAAQTKGCADKSLGGKKKKRDKT